MINNISTIRTETVLNSNQVESLAVKKQENVRRIDEIRESEKKQEYSFDEHKQNFVQSEYFQKQLKEVNDELLRKNIEFNFERNDELNKTIIYLKDIEKNKIIAQIPSEDMLRISKYIKNFVDSYDNKGNKETIASFSTIIDTYA